MTGALALAMVARLREVWAAKGYAWFEGRHNINLFGVRSSERKAGKFDDAIGVAFEDMDGRWVLQAWEATTDPFAYYLRKPINEDGTAILVPGQYRGAYVLGRHRGDHDALVQRGPVRVWRDDNRDAILDWQPEDSGREGYFGINIHRPTSSAGCQMFKRWRDLELLLSICRASVQRYGPRISYTLIEEADLLDNSF